MHLRRFKKEELIFSQDEARRILIFFFGQSFANEQLTDEDIGFAQALIIEAVEASNKMSIIDDFMRKFMWRPPASYTYIKDLVKFFIRKSVAYWWNNTDIKSLDIDKVVIYDSVKNTLAQRFRSVAEIRRQTGELIY